MVEFVIVSPALALIGLAVLQYSLMAVAKNQLNHAGFMAARAGSMRNATVESISTAYLRSLAPLYGGGANPAEIAAAVARATADMQGSYRIELINPSRASFDDFNDPALQKKLKTRSRVIPNASLAMREPGAIGAASKQNIFDANLLKLRITHGYRPGVPLVAKVFTAALAAADDGKDAFSSRLRQAGRIPVVSDFTLQMNSDAIEWADPTWTSGGQQGGTGPSGPPSAGTADGSGKGGSGSGSGSGSGNGGNGNGGNGGGGDGTSEPTAVPYNPHNLPNYPGGGTENGCGVSACPVCPAPGPESEAFPLSADVLFDFDQASLKPEGREALDELIAETREAQQDGQTITSVTVSGHTDQLGSDAVNQRLSEARAAAVRDYLKANGFPDVPIAVRGIGAADPVVAPGDCTGSREEQVDCLAPNRRVVIDIRRTEGAP